MKYAAKTKVAPEQSRLEIERILSRFGAKAFGYAWERNRAMLGFELKDRRVRFALYLETSLSQQDVRSKWRALALVIKAKLSAVEAGITTVEDEFFAHIVMPDGRTVGEWARPQIAAAYKEHGPPALPGSGP
jgi:hypothetical protein